MRFVRSEEIVHAFQWYPRGDGRRRLLPPLDEVKDSYRNKWTIRTPYANFIMSPGLWVTINESGFINVYDEAVFTSMFQSVGD
jgi:hypothetical protein